MKFMTKRLTWAALALALSVVPIRLAQAQSGSGAPQQQPPPPSEADFPHIIPVETWLAQEGFRSGDRIMITLVRGNRKKIEPGGTYLVEGTYTLRSASEARLALSLTSSGPSGRSSWSPYQNAAISAGDGAFALVATMGGPGQYHVSFYIPDSPGSKRSSSAGGIYFDNR
jgi:hypothetical protein